MQNACPCSQSLAMQSGFCKISTSPSIPHYFTSVFPAHSPQDVQMVLGEEAETELEILLERLPQRRSFATISSLPSPCPGPSANIPRVGLDIQRSVQKFIEFSVHSSFGPSWLSSPCLGKGPNSVTIFERIPYFNGVQIMCGSKNGHQKYMLIHP